VIDPHVHLRDWNQNNKETLDHGIDVAYRAGLDCIFEMPNTDPAITSRDSIEKRIELADKAVLKLGVPFFHGLYAGITPDPAQIEEMVKSYSDLFPRVIGLKMFAGNSTGNMGILDERSQKRVYSTLAKLGYKGVLAVHCEDERFISKDIWHPEKPFSHCLSRPPTSEIESVKNQLEFARKAGFKGTLYICHVSVPYSLEEIERVRKHSRLNVCSEISPHHAVLNDKYIEKQDGLLLKMNPPLRPKWMQERMLNSVLEGRIDWIGTDHAPHTLKDKLEGGWVDDKYVGHCSGIPGLPFYPLFIKLLRSKGASEQLIDDITHNNIVKTFGIEIPNTKRVPEVGLAKEYEFDPYRGFKPKV